MPVTPETVADIAPFVAKIPAARVNRFIVRAQSQLSATAWGALYDAGVEFLVAHMLQMSMSGGQIAGPVIREKVGDLEKQYAAPSLGVGGYQLTPWGIEYQRLVELVSAGAISVTGLTSVVVPTDTYFGGW